MAKRGVALEDVRPLVGQEGGGEGGALVVARHPDHFDLDVRVLGRVLLGVAAGGVLGSGLAVLVVPLADLDRVLGGGAVAAAVAGEDDGAAGDDHRLDEIAPGEASERLDVFVHRYLLIVRGRRSDIGGPPDISHACQGMVRVGGRRSPSLSSSLPARANATNVLDGGDSRTTAGD